MKTRQVIIGNGPAALSAIRELRHYDKSCHITVISAEDCLAYSPPLLPYYVSGKINRNLLFMTKPGFYRHNAAKFLPGSRVEDIDTQRQRVVLGNGDRVGYDQLLIATGASARRPSLNIESNEVRTLRTLDDADKILGIDKHVKTALVVGAGLVGLETTNALYQRGIAVTVMAKSKQVLSQNCNTECAGIIQGKISKKGVHFLLGEDIMEVTCLDNRLEVLTDQGSTLTVDMLIIGRGIEPNTAVLKNSGILVDRGIPVNELMQTNIPNIYAAGDVTSNRNLLTGKQEVIATWPNACIQGQKAGSNMAGKKIKFPGFIGYNVLSIFGLVAAFLGETTDSPNEREILKHHNEKKGVYRSFNLKNNRVIGATLLEAITDTGIILNLMKNQVDISPYKDVLVRSPISWAHVFHKMGPF